MCPPSHLQLNQLSLNQLSLIPRGPLVLPSVARHHLPVAETVSKNNYEGATHSHFHILIIRRCIRNLGVLSQTVIRRCNEAVNGSARPLECGGIFQPMSHRSQSQSVWLHVEPKPVCLRVVLADICRRSSLRSVDLNCIAIVYEVKQSKYSFTASHF